MKKVIYLSILLTALFISSCRQPRDLVYQNVENFKLQKLGLSQTAMSMDIVLYNPNSYNLRLKGADVDVFINDNHLGKMTVDGHYKINKLDTFKLPVTLDVDLKNALPNILQLVFNSDVNVRLKGTIRAGRHGAFIGIPINYEGRQDILQGIK